MGYKDDRNKELICRQCSLFLDSEDLVDGKCPECGNDEAIFLNCEE